MRKRLIASVSFAALAMALFVGSPQASTYTSLSAYNAGEGLSTTITGFAGFDHTGAVVPISQFFAATLTDEPSAASLSVTNTYLINHGFPGTLTYQSPGSVPGDLKSGTVSIDDFAANPGNPFPANLWYLI